MNNKKSTKRALISSVLSLVLCMSMLIGTTFAWFTDTAKSGVNNIQSGKLDIQLLDADGVSLEGKTLNFQKAAGAENETVLWEPGVTYHTQGFQIKNAGNLYLKFEAVINGITNGDAKLLEAIDFYIATSADAEISQGISLSGEKVLAPGTYYDGKEEQGSVNATTLYLIGHMKESAGNEYQDLTLDGLGITIYATQFTSEYDSFDNQYDAEANYLEPWDGTLASELDVNEETKTITISEPTELALFAKNVNDGKNYKGWKVVLAKSINLNNQPWTPIGPNADESNKFAGTFDGQHNTIYNLNVNQDASYHAAGLFGALNGTAKNLYVKNAEIVSISTGAATDNGNAVIAGSIYTTGKIDNCHVVNATVKANRYVAGIAGYVYGSVTNCSVSNAEIVASCDNLTGSWDNGDKAGAIVGYFASENTYEVAGNKVTDTTVTAYRDLGGVAGCALDGGVKNNTVSNVTLIQNNLHNYKEYTDLASANIGSIVGRGTTDASNTGEATIVSGLASDNVDDLKDALEEGGNVILGDDAETSADQSNGYGATGIVVDNGTVFDGQGNTLTTNDANTTWDSAVNLKHGTVKNLTIKGAFRGIFMSGANGDVVVDNCFIDDVCYTFNSDAGSKDYSVTIKNTTLNGWTSYSDVHKHVYFENCTFGQGTGGYKYAFCRPYNASTYTNCVFEEGFEFDTTKTKDLTFINCYYGDTLITAENAASLGNGETTFFYNGVGSVQFK